MSPDKMPPPGPSPEAPDQPEPAASPADQAPGPGWRRATRDRYHGGSAAGQAGAKTRTLTLTRGGLATTSALLWGAWATMSTGWFLMVLLGIDAVRFGPYDPRIIAAAVAAMGLYAFVRALLDHGRVRHEGRFLVAERAPFAPRATVLIPYRQLVRLSAKPLRPSLLDRLRAGGREELSMPWSVEARLRDGSRAALPFRLPPDEARELMRDIHALAAAQQEPRSAPGSDDWV